MYVDHVLRGLASEVRAVAGARTPIHRRLRDVLVAVAIATLGVDVVCAALALEFERHAHQTQITGIGTALFWTSTQLLTVSSSVQNPLTSAGQVLDVGMEIYAVTIVASLTGAVGSFMVHRARSLEDEGARVDRAD